MIKLFATLTQDQSSVSGTHTGCSIAFYNSCSKEINIIFLLTPVISTPVYNTLTFTYPHTNNHEVNLQKVIKTLILTSKNETWAHAHNPLRCDSLYKFCIDFIEVLSSPC